MTLLFISALIVTHLLAYLTGKSITENKAIDRAYPDYKRLKDKEIQNQE